MGGDNYTASARTVPFGWQMGMGINSGTSIPENEGISSGQRDASTPRFIASDRENSVYYGLDKHKEFVYFDSVLTTLVGRYQLETEPMHHGHALTTGMFLGGIFLRYVHESAAWKSTMRRTAGDFVS